MGVWGAAIFSDDDAADIRSDYRDLIGDGFSGPEATDKILSEYSPDTEDSVLWLALAAVQWRCGRLEHRVKTRALEIIRDGSDLVRWQGENPKLIPQRLRVLEKLKAQLLSEQPPESKIKQRFRSSCDWGVGEVIAYELMSGKKVLFRIVGVQGDKGGTWPVCELLDWCGSQIPAEEVINNLPVKLRRDLRPGGWGSNQIGIGAASQREFPHSRLQRLHIRSKPSQPLKIIGSLFILWRHLDKCLAEDFDLQ